VKSASKTAALEIAESIAAKSSLRKKKWTGHRPPVSGNFDDGGL
jgi:hypothetical protein